MSDEPERCERCGEVIPPGRSECPADDPAAAVPEAPTQPKENTMNDQLLNDLHFIDDTRNDALRAGFEAGVKAATEFFGAYPVAVEWKPVPATVLKPAGVRPVLRFETS